MTRRKLPIGMQTFRDLRESNCYYVDKTAYVRRLLDEGKHYFLSRPRRFGKSLFLDTCKELFEGNEPLFEGLAIHDRWDWSVRHPVLRLSFGSGNFNEPGQLALNLREQLAAAERRAEVVTDYDTAPGRLSALLVAIILEYGGSSFKGGSPRRASRCPTGGRRSRALAERRHRRGDEGSAASRHGVRRTDWRTLLAGIGARQVEPFESLQPLVDLAEGDLDGPETVVHAAEVVTDHGDLAGEVGLDGGDLGGEVGLDGSNLGGEIRTQIVEARVDVVEARVDVVEACVELDGEQSAEGDTCPDDAQDDRYARSDDPDLVSVLIPCAVLRSYHRPWPVVKCNHLAGCRAVAASNFRSACRHNSVRSSTRPWAISCSPSCA